MRKFYLISVLLLVGCTQFDEIPAPESESVAVEPVVADVLMSYPGDAPLLISHWDADNSTTPIFKLYCNWGEEGTGNGFYDHTSQLCYNNVYTPDSIVYNIYFPQ